MAGRNCGTVCCLRRFEVVLKYVATLNGFNKLDASTKGSMLFRNPRALSSALAPLGSPQPWALGFLNSVDPLVLASNYYILNLDDKINLSLHVCVFVTLM